MTSLRAMTSRVLPSRVLPMIAALVAFGSAAQASPQRPIPMVTVNGEAKVALTPDLAQATSGVTTEGKTAREASDANAQVMTAVTAALKEAGIAEKDIQTSQFNISPVYSQQRPNQNKPEEPRIVGYRVSNQVQFRIRDIAKVSDVLDRAITAGATDMRGLNFTVSDISKSKDKARADAIADARRRAEIYAKAAGAQVGRAMAIAETGASPPRPVMQMAAMERMAASAPPISAGETTLHVGVTVSFELLH